MKKQSNILFLTFLILLLVSCDKLTNSDDIDVEAEILKEMQDKRIPSVVACIVKGENIVWEGAFGLADKENSISSTRNTLYNIESITKLFVSISTFQLWENGIIDLNADVNQYLPFNVRNPNYPDIQITAHMLLNHTSSLAWPVQSEDHLYEFEYFFTHNEVPLISEWIPEYILPDGIHYKNAVWKKIKPGKKELYSNIGVSLLALIIENITETDFRDYCQENILEPLEMNYSAFRIQNMNEDLLATPYYNSNYPIHQFVYRHYPAGNLKSNIEDFSHFIVTFLNNGLYKNNKILKTTTIEKMFEIQNPRTGMANLWNHRLGDRIGKAGGGTGYSAWTELDLNNNTGLFIFSNKYNESVYPSGRIYDLIRYQCNNY